MSSFSHIFASRTSFSNGRRNFEGTLIRKGDLGENWSGRILPAR